VNDRLDVAIVGAGFGGLTLAHRLAGDGIDNVVLFDREDGVGGTWRANDYPGAACDVPSHLYSLAAAPNPDWSRAYAAQPEILSYIEHCYDRLDVRRKVRVGTDIVTATWSEANASWQLCDRRGVQYEASVVVTATGLFHSPSVPALPGLDEFAGTRFHSARWNHERDITGARVAVVGTGASAIQIVPAIVARVAHLDLYQRTAPWVLPRHDPPYTPEQRAAFDAHPEEVAEHRQGLYDMFEQTTAFLTGDEGAESIAAISREYLRRKVSDPALRAKLTPDHPFGCTRTLVSSDYYPAVQHDRVELVTEGIERITPTGIRTLDGIERPADTIVLCTGFRASDYLSGMQVTGRNATSIHDRWAGLPRAYHGMAVPEFPNFFMMYGPNTNQGGNSILLVLEAQAQFVANALETMRRKNASTIEVSVGAMDRYERQLERDLRRTVWSEGCRSYFHGAAGDIVTQLPHTSGWYRDATQRINQDDFMFGGVTSTT
jgi:cation diffusion facilitator CzcD-associated flavoprotein CzcO